MSGLNLMLEREVGISLPPWMSEQFLATDPKVVAAEVKGFGDGEQVREYLGVIRAPALLLVGAEEDPEGEAAKVASLLPAGRAVTLPGLGHVGAFLAYEQALPHVRQTLRGRFAS
jgi:pimeloyl-ACP methyl ester carboxylesterase